MTRTVLHTVAGFAVLRQAVKIEWLDGSTSPLCRVALGDVSPSGSPEPHPWYHAVPRPRYRNAWLIADLRHLWPHLGCEPRPDDAQLGAHVARSCRDREQLVQMMEMNSQAHWLPRRREHGEAQP